MVKSSKVQNITLADAITKVLEELGTNFVFGVGGANIEDFFDSIYRANIQNSKLKLILAKSEYSAAFMADGFARMHGNFGVCCSTSGGGMMNLAVGVAESYADSVPLLAIIGQPPSYLEGKGAFQDSSGKNGSVDALGLWSSITKYTAKITDPEKFWEILSFAIESIFYKNPGPVSLLIPKEIFRMHVPPKPTNFLNSLKLNNHRIFSAVNLPAIHILYQKLEKSICPLIVVGKFVRYSISGLVIEKIAEHFNAKIVTTLADVSAGVQESEFYLGQIGICGHHEAHDFLKQKVDLILILDDDLSLMSTTGVKEQFDSTEVIYIGRDTSRVSSIVNADILIEASVNTIIEELIAMIHRNFANTLKQKKASINRIEIESCSNSSKNITTLDTLKYIEYYLKHVDYCFFDAGNCVAIAAHWLKFPSRVKTITSLGMGNMGYAIPAGIGAQLGAYSKQKTIVFSGDGGFLISGFEIHTAVEHKLPILFIIFNNNKHGMCKTRHELFFDNRVIGSDYQEVNIANSMRYLCNSSQLWSVCVEDASELQKALQDYFANNLRKTGIIEIKISTDEMPPFIPFLEASRSNQILKTT